MQNAVQTIDSVPKITDAAQLGARITELCSYIHAATYRLLVLIREFDDCDGWHGVGLVSCAHWLNFQCGIGMNAAREKVRVAHALKDLPKISRAFKRGELSFSKVRAMTRVADAGNEDYLMMIARHGTAHHVEKLVQKFRRAERLQDADSANRQHRDRYVDHYYDADGCLVIKARLPAEQGALVVKALEHALEHEPQAQKDVTAVISGDEDREPAVKALERALKHEPPGQKDVTAVISGDEDREPIAARWADALVEVAETYLQNPELQGSSANRYQVVVHVTAGQVPLGQTFDAHIEDGPDVTAETSRRLGCDCSQVRVLEDANGQPLSIGRKTRSIPPAIRRALRLRDKGCRFPGCTNTRFVDGHHIRHWADGGETSLDNLVQLCRHHHRLVHEGGYDCKLSSTGDIAFSAPHDQVLSDHAPIRNIEEKTYEWLDREMRDSEFGSCAAQWYAGETMDWDLAVAGLFSLR